jgi:hypothetical protein
MDTNDFTEADGHHHAISFTKSCYEMQASAKKTEISCTLSVSYLRKILPKFISNEAKIRDMVCMSFTTTFFVNTTESPTSSHVAGVFGKEEQTNTKRVQRRPLSEISAENKKSTQEEWTEGSISH